MNLGWSERFGWFVGYRAIACDYEDGQGRNYRRYDLRQHGPGAGIAISFWSLDDRVARPSKAGRPGR